MIVFPCKRCQTSLCAEENQVGQLVRCPTCSGVLRVVGGSGGEQMAAPSPPPLPSSLSPAPPPLPTGQTIFGVGSGIARGRRYGFNCAYCSSRLEAVESMAAQEGQCPTCGNQITIPILDRYGRLIDPKTREVIKQAPHPVHAYAASGERAPRILRLEDGRQIIQCSRCSASNPVSANNCKACGMPFTMDGTLPDNSGSANGFCVASLVLGIIGLPGGCTIVLPVLAIIFGIIGLSRGSAVEGRGGGKGMAIAGMCCGGAGLIVAVLFLWH